MKVIAAMAIMALLLVSMVSAIPMAKPQMQNRDAVQIDEAAVAELKEQVPAKYELAEIEVDAVEIPKRFLMWTNDGAHIMWGRVGNGYFVGQDDLGKRVWGVFGNNMFAGLYDGEFFYGHYKWGRWHAYNLFGLEKSAGRYIVFPTWPRPVAISAAE